MVSPSQSGNKHNQMKEPELMKIGPVIFLSLSLSLLFIVIAVNLTYSDN